eukprot:Skav229390  [mRNA]  locus=scaffold904:9714:11648:+ [translate_table: standard]
MPSPVKKALEEILQRNEGDEPNRLNDRLKEYWEKLTEHCINSWDAVKSAGPDELRKILPRGMADDLFKQAEKAAKERKALPFPDLPPGEYPTPSEMSRAWSDQLPCLPDVRMSNLDCPDFESLSCGNWLSVMLNCGVLKGCHMGTLDSASEVLLRPPNSVQSVRQVTNISQQSVQYSSGLSFGDEFEKHAERCDFRAFVNFSCPFVAASGNYKRQTDQSRIKHSTKMTQIVKTEMPIGSWSLKPGYNVQVDDDDGGSAHRFSVNPDLDKDFRELLNTEVKRENLPKFRNELQQKFGLWGDVVATRVRFGLALYIKETMQCSSEQQMQGARDVMQAALNGGSPFFQFRAGGDWGKTSSEETAKRFKEERKEWTAIGGAACSSPDDLAKRGDQVEEAKRRRGDKQGEQEEEEEEEEERRRRKGGDEKEEEEEQGGEEKRKGGGKMKKTTASKKEREVRKRKRREGNEERRRGGEEERRRGEKKQVEEANRRRGDKQGEQEEERRTRREDEKEEEEEKG